MLLIRRPMKIPNVVGQGDVKKSNKIMSKVNEFLPEDTDTGNKQYYGYSRELV